MDKGEVTTVAWNQNKLKQAVFEIFKAPKQGDLLMDAPKVTPWRELTTYAQDREYSKEYKTVVSGEGRRWKTCGG